MSTINLPNANASAQEVPTVKSWVILAVLCAAQLMLIVDVVVVNVALPSIRSNLAVADGRLQLISVAYTLVFGSLLVVSGKAGDVLGRHRLLLAGIVLFAGASTVAGLAQSEVQLIAARALQGLGAALVSPNALALLMANFSDGEPRNRALGFWGAVGSGGAILGQLLGGVLTSYAGWRWVFLINVPVGILAFLLVLVLLKESERRAASGLDIKGALALTAGIAALALALMRVGEQRLDILLVIFALASAAALTSFVAIERRHAAPVLDLNLLRNRSVLGGNAVLALNSGALVATLFYATLYLQVVLDYSPAEVGLGFAPVTGIVLAVSPLAGRLIGRTGVATLLLAGGGLACAGMAYLTRASAGGDYFSDVLPGLALIGLGSGLAFAPAYVAGMSGVSEEAQGTAGGVLATSQELGAAIGLALVVSFAGLMAEGAGSLEAYRFGFAGAAIMQLASIVLVIRLLGPPAQTSKEVIHG
jgi:EmrB/QacA subfamily drug resistance transporter